MTPDMTTTFQVSFIACTFLALHVRAVIPRQIYNTECHIIGFSSWHNSLP